MSLLKSSTEAVIGGQNIFERILAFFNQEENPEKLHRIVSSMERLIQDTNSPSIAKTSMTLLSYWFWLYSESHSYRNHVAQHYKNIDITKFLHDFDEAKTKAKEAMDLVSKAQLSLEQAKLKSLKAIGEKNYDLAVLKAKSVLTTLDFGLSQSAGILFKVLPKGLGYETNDPYIRDAGPVSLEERGIEYGGIKIFIERIFILFCEIAGNLGVKNNGEIINGINRLIPQPSQGWNPKKDDLAHESYDETSTKIEDLSIFAKHNNWAEKEMQDLKAMYFSLGLLNFQDKINYQINELTWRMKITFLGESNNPGKIGYLLQCFSQVLDSIDGVDLKVESWGQGSLWADMKIMFRDSFARDEASQVLENLQDGFTDTSVLIGEGAEAVFHGKPTGEVKKLNAETTKLELESEGIKNELNATPDSEELKKITLMERYLDIDAKQEDLRRKKIENQMLAMDAMKKMSDLLRDGILKQDEVKIEINNILFLLKTDSQIEIGSSMKIIKKQADKETDIDKSI